MSQGPLEFKGRPKSEQEAADYYYFHGCGQGGNGACVETLDAESQVLQFRVPKFITYNRKIVFENPFRFGIRIYDDGGPTGTPPFGCDHSTGTEQTFWLGLSSDDDPNISEQVAKSGVELSGALPYEIEFADPKQLPQPTDAEWEAIIYAHVWWGNPNFVAVANFATLDEKTAGRLDIVKHDYDIKV